MNRCEMINHKMGCFLGAAFGDALGAGVEFYHPQQIAKAAGEYPIRHFISGGLGFKAGEITDDTEQAILLAEAIGETNNAEEMKYFFGKSLANWAKTARDVGCQTRRGINNFEKGLYLSLQERLTTSPSNGAIMRSYPVAIRFHQDYEKLTDYTWQSCYVTHPHPEALHCAICFNFIIAEILNRVEYNYGSALNKNSIITDAVLKANYRMMSYTNPYYKDVIQKVSNALFSGEAPKDFNTKAVDTLQLAVFHFLNHDNAEDAIAHCVSAGGDADTNGAVCGAMAGAFYGMNFPKRWSDELKDCHKIVDIVNNYLI